MKAVAMKEFGLDKELVIYEDFEVPTLESDDVLIEIENTGISPYDWHVRDGEQDDKRKFPMPFVLGWDISGTVKEVGQKVTDFKVGEEVIALQDLERNGGYAEYAAVPVNNVVLKPANLSFEEAATIPINAVTTYQALVKNAKLQKDDKVLIHGGAGGIGIVAIQLAKHYGAHVATTASTRNHSFLKSLGADEVIDYNKTDFEDVVKDFDVVLDTRGEDTLERSFDVLKDGGRLISIREQISDDKANEHQLEVATFVDMNINKKDLQMVVDLYEAGHIKAFFDTIYPLSQANAAHERSLDGHARGKIVLKIKE